MGIVASCCGLCGSGSDVEDRGETSRLLPDDPSRTGYGVMSSQRGYQPNSESLRREREALDGICHAMSDNVEDLFAAKVQGNGRDHEHRPETPELGQTPDDLAMRTIKRGKAGPIFNNLNKRPDGWRAVQDAIG